MKRKIENIQWQEVSFLRPLDYIEVVDTLTHLAGLTGRKSFCGKLEVRITRLLT